MRSLESVATGGCDGSVVDGMRIFTLESVDTGRGRGFVIFGPLLRAH